MEEKFPQVAATGDGPDIIFWRTTALVATLNLACWLKSPRTSVPGQAVSVYLGCRTLQRQVIAYPIAVEALSLIYNKDLLRTRQKPGKRSPRWIKN